MQEAADALMANQGAIVNSIIERTRHEATDDEREALNTLYWTHPDGHTTGLSLDAIDAILASEVWRFRRSEVPEPSTECPKCGVRATGQTPSTFYTHHDETCDGALEEPQGEPSDAQVIERLRGQIEEARNAWWSATEQGDNGLVYTDRIEDAMDGIWSAIGHADWTPDAAGGAR